MRIGPEPGYDPLRRVLSFQVMLSAASSGGFAIQYRGKKVFVYMVVLERLNGHGGKL